MPGYLSLHQTVQSLTIKWTPNQLMNGYAESECIDKSSYWAYALNVNVDEIVYVHCHQARGGDTGGTVILVGQDGVQRPPIHFPEGGHMAAFLSCLETGNGNGTVRPTVARTNCLRLALRFTATRPAGSSTVVAAWNRAHLPVAPEITASAVTLRTRGQR